MMPREGRPGLGLLDRVVLLFAWITTCGLVYLLGFYVGKGTQEQRGGLEERLVRLPVTSRPPPEGQGPKSKSDITFYDTLVSGAKSRERDGGPVSTTTLPARPAPPAVANATPPAASPPPTPAKPAAAEPAAAPPPPSASRPVPPRTPPEAAAAPLPPPLPPPSASRPAPHTPPEPAANPGSGPEATAHPAPPPPSSPGGGWTVQASPTRSREEAEVLLQKLRTRGYDATIVRVLRDSDTWYRVRVGRFATSEQANELMQRLRDEGVAHVFVASE